MKIDVEEAEKFVLEGSLETLSKKELQPKMFLVELYDLNFIHYHTSVDEIVKFLNSYRYNAFVISKEHPIPFTKEHYNIFDNVFLQKRTSPTWRKLRMFLVLKRNRLHIKHKKLNNEKK